MSRAIRAIAMIVVGRLINRLDPRWMILTGLSIVALSLFEMTGFTPDVSEWTLIRTCFPTHHLNFAKDDILWTSAGVVGPGVLGWLDVKKFEQTKDERVRIVTP